MSFIYLTPPHGYEVYRWENDGPLCWSITFHTKVDRKIVRCPSYGEACCIAWRMWANAELYGRVVEFEKANRHRKIRVGQTELEFRPLSDANCYRLYPLAGMAPVWTGESINEAMVRFAYQVGAIEGPSAGPIGHARYWESAYRRGFYTLNLKLDEYARKLNKQEEELAQAKAARDQVRRECDAILKAVDTFYDLAPSGGFADADDLQALSRRIERLERSASNAIDRADAIENAAKEEEEQQYDARQDP